jgi:hypothetical protein
MKRVSFWAPVGMVAILVATPATASPALIIGVAAVAAAVAVSAGQQPHEAWAYTDKYGWVGGAEADVSSVDVPLQSKSRTSRQLIDACREALISTGKRYDLAELEVGGAGRQLRVNGRLIVPLDVRAIYRINGVHEVKRSKVRCELDRAGRVVSTS